MIEDPHTMMKPGSLELGRLAIVKDPEGKRRVIAMSDY
jgi:hypothetical protein